MSSRTSRRGSLRGSQVPPVHVARRKASPSGIADELGLLEAVGVFPDDWQEQILADWLAMDRRGRWEHLTCGLAVPRQNGKNALLEFRELIGVLGYGERILHTAHEVKTAQQHWKRLQYYFGVCVNDPSSKFPDLNAMVSKISRVTGQEGVFLANGGSIQLIARSKNSGRGYTVDTLVMDESQETTDADLEALLPTTSAAPHGNPQWIYTGTPPGPEANGDVFARVRREALSDAPGRMTWASWEPPAKFDRDDRKLWQAMNPAVESGRLRMEVIEGERKRFTEQGFDRERLGWWTPDAGIGRAISADLWSSTAVTEPPAGGIRSFGVAFSLDGSRQAVAGAIKAPDGTVHVELIDAQSGNTDAGVAALADWLAERWRDTAMIGISGRAGAAALQDELHRRHVPTHVSRTLNTSDYFGACSIFMDSLKSSQVTHPQGRDTDVLEASVAVCDQHMRGSAWGWEATTDDGDETPLEAVSVANWAARTSRRQPGRKQVLV